MDTSTEQPLSILLDYQKRWLEMNSPINILVKSRRIGGTYATAIKAVVKALEGRNQYYSSYNKDSCRTFIQYCKHWAQVFAGAVMTSVTEDDDLIYRLRFKNGASIEAIPSHSVNLRGLDGDIILDEAAYRNLRELMDSASAAVIWGYSLDIVSSQGYASSDFNKIIEEIESGQMRGEVLTVTFRDAIEQQFYRKVCERNNRVWTPEGESEYVKHIYATIGSASQWELDCVPRQGGGDLIKFASFQFEELELPYHTSYVRVWDFASTEEMNATEKSYYTACLLIALLPGKLYVCGGDARRNNPAQNNEWMREVNRLDPPGTLQILEAEPASQASGYLGYLESEVFTHRQVIRVRPLKNKVLRVVPALERVRCGKITFSPSCRWIAEKISEVSLTPIPLVQDLADCLAHADNWYLDSNAPTLG